MKKKITGILLAVMAMASMTAFAAEAPVADRHDMRQELCCWGYGDGEYGCYGRGNGYRGGNQ